MENGQTLTLPLTIQLDDRFKLKATRTGWEVFQHRAAVKGPKKGKLGWYSEGHFDTLPWALRGAYRLMLHEGRGQATLEQLARRIEQAEQTIVKSLEDSLGKADVVAISKGPW